MTELNLVCNEIKNENISYKTLEGQKYLVAPVVIVQEQVLNGELLTANELSKYIAAWNGVPVTVPHPEDDQGRKVSANSSPKTLERYKVGIVFNVSYDQQKKQLKGEVWINEDKAKKIPKGEKAVKKIKNNKPLDVSSGYFSDTSKESGYHNGQKYNGKQYNLRPDHLALLPETKGACSWQDGCGIRANEQQGGGGIISTKEKVETLFGRFLDSLGPLDEEEEIVDNDLSDRDVRSQLRKKLADKFGGKKISVRVREVFPNYVIFRVIDNRMERQSSLYQMSYSRNDNEDEVSLGEEAQEVQRKVEYEPINNNKEDEEMKVNEDASREDIIANVLDCDCNKLSESTLKAMDDEELEFYAGGLDCNEEEGEESTEGDSGEDTSSKQEDEDNEEVQANQLQGIINKALEPVTNKLEQLEEEINKDKVEQKRPYIDLIANSEDNPFPEEELKEMSLDKLKSLSRAFGSSSAVDYSGLGGPRVNLEQDEDVDYEGSTIDDLKSNQGGSK